MSFIICSEDARGRMAEQPYKEHGPGSFPREAGAVGPDNIEPLAARSPDVPLAFGKWDRSLDSTLETVESAVHTIERSAPIDLLRSPPDSAKRFVDKKRRISVSRDVLM